MDDKIIIPYGLTMEQEYFPGFGSRELRQFLIGGAASAVLGALLLIFSGQLLALIVCIMIGASGSIMAVRKDPYTRISVVMQIGNMIKFRRTQQNFRYVYKSPWEQSWQYSHCCAFTFSGYPGRTYSGVKYPTAPRLCLFSQVRSSARFRFRSAFWDCSDCLSRWRRSAL